jgi:hypothetical protein
MPIVAGGSNEPLSLHDRNGRQCFALPQAILDLDPNQHAAAGIRSLPTCRISSDGLQPSASLGGFRIAGGGRLDHAPPSLQSAGGII